MSRNDLVLVVKDLRHRCKWYYVMHAPCADDDLDEFAEASIRRTGQRRTSRYSTALVIAHGMQETLDTEYGVRVMELHDWLHEVPLD